MRSRREKGRGTTFTVQLPRGARAVKEVLPPERVEAPLDEHRRVLLVEDDENARLFVRHTLKNAIIVEAVSPKAALAVAEGDERFDVVLLDINLGEGMTGSDLLSALRTMQACRGAQFVAMTAYALPGDKERFLAEGFDSYLPKPFTRAAIMGLLKGFEAR